MFVSQLETIKQLIDYIYLVDILQNTVTDLAVFKSYVVLTTLNQIVIELNIAILQQFPSPVYIYLSMDFADVNKALLGIDKVLVEHLQSINLLSLLLSKLDLKVRVPIILLHNLLLQEGLCNSTYIVVTSLCTYYIKVKLLGSDFHSQLCTIP